MIPSRSPSWFDEELQPRWQALLFRVTLVLLLVGFAGILARNGIADVEFRRSLGTLHRSAGHAVLLITLLRISTAKLRPQLLANVRASRSRFAGMMLEVSLSLALIATPLLGWALTSARGQTVLFLGAIPLPRLLQNEAAWADSLLQWHWLATGFLLGLIAVHSAFEIGRRVQLRLRRSAARTHELLLPQPADAP